MTPAGSTLCVAVLAEAMAALPDSEARPGLNPPRVSSRTAQAGPLALGGSFLGM